MKEAFGALVRWSGLDAALRFLFARRRVTIVVYHDPDPDILRQHLAWYAKRYNFTTLDAVADAMDSGRWKSLPRYPLVLTLDDGHIGNAKLEPLFREYGVRPTMYLCSRIVGTARPYWWQTAAADRIGPEALKVVPDAERRRRLAEAGDDPDVDARGPRQALSWDEVRTMAGVYDYGGHTRHHPILLQCDDQTAAEEIGLCKAEIEDALHRPCAHFAYTNGDFGEREVALIRASGYRTARSIEPGWNGPTVDPFRLKAFPVSDDVSVGWLAVQVTGIPSWARKLKGLLRGRGASAAPAYPEPAGALGGRG
ncbi:MAG TPA: polysaccharide deacetylase family protein [Azospirillum sp.]|nr:polysaccharide deacetylase family protein [Azospirillum sp.]